MTIGYLGPKNSFTYQATQAVFTTEEKQPYQTIPFCIQAAARGEIEFAVIPIENSLEGSVHASMDQLFISQDLQVVQELILPIRQQLMMVKGQKMPEKILSHPQALAQSQAYLAKNFPFVPVVQAPSTTYAAEYSALHPEERVAAIASKQAAKAFDLEIIGHDIQDNEQNQTRFWVLTKSDKAFHKASVMPEKMTLFLTLPSNQAGALHQILAAFAWRKIDLSKIESRPLKTSLGHYYFIVDIAIHQNLSLIHYALEEINQLGAAVHTLGPYEIQQLTE